MNPLLPIVLGIFLVVLLLVVRWKWRAKGIEFFKATQRWARKNCGLFGITQTGASVQCGSCSALQESSGLDLQPKDSLDDHLNSLTKKLAEKIRTDAKQDHKVRWVTCQYLELKENNMEGRLRISKSKIREAQCEIETLHGIDVDVRDKYKEVMDSLRQDLTENERECKRLQEQIEWVSRRRAEIRDDVRRGQKLYGEAAAELANNLAALQRGRAAEKHVKPQEQQQSWCTTRHRQELDKSPQPTFSYIRPLYYPATVKTD